MSVSDMFTGLHRDQELELLRGLSNGTVSLPLSHNERLLWWNQIFDKNVAYLEELRALLKLELSWGARNLLELARDFPGVAMVMDAVNHLNRRIILSRVLLKKHFQFGGAGALERLDMVVRSLNIPSEADFHARLDRGVRYTVRDWELRMMKLAGPLVATLNPVATNRASISSCCTNGAKCDLCKQVEAGFANTNRWSIIARMTRAKSVDLVSGPLPTSTATTSRLSSVTRAFKSVFSSKTEGKTVYHELILPNGYVSTFPTKPTLLELELAMKPKAHNQAPIVVKEQPKIETTSRLVDFAVKVAPIIKQDPQQSEKAQHPLKSTIRVALASSVANCLSKK